MPWTSAQFNQPQGVSMSDIDPEVPDDDDEEAAEEDEVD
jgi:hypothetical protein